MICPLMSKVESPVFDSRGVRVSESGFSSVECKGFDCAWWNDNQSCCDVSALAGSLGWISENLPT